MKPTANISHAIIEALYEQALILADEVRAAFALQPPSEREQVSQDDPLRLARSEEGLRTTTRMMHVLAWLLNQRAYLAGDMTEFQLRRHGALPEDRPSDPDMVMLLDITAQELVEETEAMHSRIHRLDRAWRERFEMQPPAIMRLRERLGFAMIAERRRHEREEGMSSRR
ncbi:MAG: DUF1465 family protein [Alteripontixanthobacter sp.]